jgi:polynucleotide 5'-hydroxyl-kinase GRC3/NOL9
MIVPDAWKELSEKLREEGEGSVYLAGATDRGKTTLCHYLQEELSQFGTLAWIDCDSGQASLGPPTTIGCAMVPGGMRWLRFIGSTSPPGHLLPFLTAAARLKEVAQHAGAAYLVIDSPGYVEDGTAQEFQIQLIDLLQPDHLVAIQRVGEIEPILSPFRESRRMQVHRFEPVAAVRRRSQEERRRYREGRFREYFQGAETQEISLIGVAVHGRVPSSFRQEVWRDLLVAFLDGERWVLALGIVQALDLPSSRMQVLASPLEQEEVASIRVGSMRWNPELGWEGPA